MARDCALGRGANHFGDVEILCVHVPNAANGQIKPETLRALHEDLARTGNSARVVCGDLNTPRRELRTGEVLSFACDRYGRLRPEGTEWNAAELGVVPGLRDLGYRDVFRDIHGYERPEPSWTWQRIAGHRGGWRLDHVFASPPLQPIAACYHHAWRDSGLSDHSALEADLEQGRLAGAVMRLRGSAAASSTTIAAANRSGRKGRAHGLRSQTLAISAGRRSHPSPTPVRPGPQR